MRKAGFHLLPLAGGALAAVLAASPILAAEQAPAAQAAKNGPIARLLRCLSILDLTDTQKADIKAIFDREKPVLEGLLAQLKTDGEALKAALAATPADPCAIGAAMLKVRADRNAIADELKAIKTDVEATLTPEQVAKLHGCLLATAGGHGAGQAAWGDIGQLE